MPNDRPPTHVLKLLADALANVAKKPKPKGKFIPAATLMNRIQRRGKGK